MSISALPAREPRTAVLLGQLRDLLAEFGQVQDWQLGDAELLHATEGLYRLGHQLDAHALRLLTQVDSRGLAPDAGSPSTAAWLSARLQMNIGAARNQVKLGHALTQRPATAAALAAGAASAPHAQVITTALAALPAAVAADQIDAAEANLLEHATRFTPKVLTRIGQHLHTALDPDGPQPQDTAAPDPGYYLNLRTNDDGSCQGQFWLEPALALAFAALIDAAAAPRPSTAQGPDPRTAGRRRHDALADLTRLARAHRADPIPGTGRPTIAVTISVDQLRAGLPGHRPDQALIPAGTLRRMTCDADLIPIVLGSRSEVLDIGRSSRTIPAKIRRALIQRDQGCAFPGCDRPPGWTQAHHIVHWSKGGLTALFNLVLLCGHHHETIHHRGWTCTSTNTAYPSSPHRHGYAPPPKTDPARRRQRQRPPVVRTSHSTQEFTQLRLTTSNSQPRQSPL